MSTALLVIDIQNDYFADGALPVEGCEAATANAARLLAAFRERGLPVVHVRHLMARPGAGFLMPGTPGAEIHADVAPLPGEVVIDKHYPNSFRATPLREHLDRLGADRLVVAGMMTQMCIDATVRAAFDFGYPVTLAHDACAARALVFGGAAVPAAQVHAAFVASLHGIFADARATADIAREMDAAPV